MILPPVFVNFFGALVKDKFNLADVKSGCTDLKDHLNDARKEAKDEDKVRVSPGFPVVFRGIVKKEKKEKLETEGKRILQGIFLVSAGKIRGALGRRRLPACVEGHDFGCPHDTGGPAVPGNSRGKAGVSCEMGRPSERQDSIQAPTRESPRFPRTVPDTK